MSRYFYSPFFALLLGLLNSAIFPFVGELSISSILYLITIPLWIRKLHINDEIVKYFFKIFIILLLTQIITEFFHDQNMVINKFKGIALTFVGMSSFFFFYVYFKERMYLLKWYLIGMAISPFFFKNSFLQDLEETYSAENVTYFKFVIAPLIINISMIFSLLIKTNRKFVVFAIINVIIGVIVLVMGARSSGIMICIPALLFIYLNRHTKKIKNIKAKIITFTFIFYLFYAFIYVPLVISGELKSGNTSQILRSKNPYNPIEILKTGRTDSLIPFYAFCDNPIIGWGYWAPDPDHKYANMMFELGEYEMSSYNNMINKIERIPGHSIIFSYASSFGFIALICMFLLWLKPTKFIFNSLNSRDRLKYFRLICYIQYSWHWFLSPAGHFKYIPGFFALIIISSIMSTYDKKYKGNKNENSIYNNW